MTDGTKTDGNGWYVFIGVCLGILLLLLASLKVVGAVFGTGYMSALQFARTLWYWHSSVAWGTNKPLPRPLLWHCVATAVIVVILALAAVAIEMGLHSWKSLGKGSQSGVFKFLSFGASGKNAESENSEDPSKWLPYNHRKYTKFTPVSVIARDEVRPSMAKVSKKERRVEDFGFILGYVGNNWRHPLAISSELSVLVAGEPRSGKTAGFVIPWVSSWQGPVVATSTKNEVLIATMLARKRVSSHVYVLAPPGTPIPEGVEPISYDICWFYPDELDTLIESAERRASVFSGVASDKSQPIWESASKQVFACLLLIGFAWRSAQIRKMGDDPNSAQPSLDDLPSETHHVDVLKHFATLEWTRDKAKTLAVERFLMEHIPKGSGHHAASYLRSVVRTFHGRSGNTEFAQTITGMIAVGLGKLNDPQIAAVFSTPWYTPVFDPEEFLAESGTLYLISRTEDSADLAKLFSLVVNEVAAAARRRAQRSRRCDPGLAMILDEICNIAPLPNLKSYMSEGGGTGITTVAVIQNLRQLVNTYGKEKADEIFSSANVVATFGGSKSPDDIQMFISQAGTKLTKMSSYDDSNKLTGRSESVQPALDTNQIANMPAGWMFVKPPSCNPVMLKTVSYWLPPDAKDADGKYRYQATRRERKHWVGEWGEDFNPDVRSYPYHGTSRALSYRAIYDLVNTSTNAIPLVPLQIEIPIDPRLGKADTETGKEEPTAAGEEATQPKTPKAAEASSPTSSEEEPTPRVTKASDQGERMPPKKASTAAWREHYVKKLDQRHAETLKQMMANRDITWEPEDNSIETLFGSIRRESGDEDGRDGK